MKTKICIVVSSPMTLRAFLAPHVVALREVHAVTVVVNASRGERFLADLAVDVIPVPIERKISPLRDLRALICLFTVFRRHCFDVVHSVTTKAGLLAMIAARVAGVPVRLHTFTGQLWVTRKGPMKLFLRTMDRIIASCATHALVDSPSQRDFLLANGIVSAAKSTVLANGSICGVNDEQFRPDPAARARIREDLRIPGDALVFLYLGRLTREKGVLDLATAFSKLAGQHNSAHLAVVGPDEGDIQKQIQERLAGFEDRVHWVGYTDRPEEYMAAADTFCLPSYREGFGQVAIEASAVGLPIIATRIQGVIDAVIDGETGLLYAPGDTDALRRHMETLLCTPDLRRQLGKAGRARVSRDFSQKLVTQALFDYYASLTRRL